MITDFYIAEERTRAKVKPLSRRAYTFISRRLPHARWQDNHVILSDPSRLELLTSSISSSGLSFVLSGDE